MGKHVLAILGGLVCGAIVIAIVQLISHTLYPLPDGLSIADHEAMAEHIQHLPIGAFILVLASWALGALVAGFVAARLDKPHGRVPAILSGVVLTLYGFLTLLFIEHPLWFWVAGLSLFVPMAYFGYHINKKLSTK